MLWGLACVHACVRACMCEYISIFICYTSKTSGKVDEIRVIVKVAINLNNSNTNKMMRNMIDTVTESQCH